MTAPKAKTSPIVPASAARGRRSPELLAEHHEVPSDPPATALVPDQQVQIYYVVGRRALNYRGAVLQPGDEVPGAEDWPRVEAWVSARQIVRCSRLVSTAAPEPTQESETA